MTENFDQAREQQEQKFQDMKHIFGNLGELETQPSFDKNSGLVKLKYINREEPLYFNMENGKFIDEYGIVDYIYTGKLEVALDEEKLNKEEEKTASLLNKLQNVYNKVVNFLRGFGGKLGKEIIPDFHKKLG